MKVLKKAMALFLAMLMVLAVAPSAFAEEAEVVVPDADVSEDAAEEVNPFAFIGMFFESIASILRSVVQFLENMFSGSAGNDALENLK